MKKLCAGLLLLIFMVFAACSGGGKYGEVKSVMSDYIKANEDAAAALEKADTGQAVAKALEPYVEKMTKLSTKMESFDKKFPELKGEPPEELKELNKKFEESLNSFVGMLMPKIMQFVDDPDVKQAMEKFDKMAPK